MKKMEVIMKEIKRDQYLKQLLSYQWDGQIKVILRFYVSTL